MRFTIKLKLALAFALVILLTCTIAWLGIANMGTLNATLVEMADDEVKRLEMSQDRNIDLLRVMRAEAMLTMAGTKEDAARFEVEVTKPDGNTVDVRLDQNYQLVVVEGDNESSDDAGS